MKSREMDGGMDSLVKAMAERQDAIERELGALAAAVKRLEAKLDTRPAEPGEAEDYSSAEGTVEVLTASQPGAAARKHGVKAEVKAVIAAAAAVAGEMAKTRKTRPMPGPQDSGNAWSQQGRVGVVSSHNLR
jgi:hypothetical protein